VPVSNYRCLEVSLFKNHQDFKDEDSEKQQEERGKCSWPYRPSIISTITRLHALNGCSSLFCISWCDMWVWVDVAQPYCHEFLFKSFILRDVSWLVVFCENVSYFELWSSILQDVCWPVVFHHAGWWLCELWELVIVECRGLSKVWYGGEGCGLDGLWLILLKSAKNQFLVVDPQENIWHHVSDMVEWRGTANVSSVTHDAKGAIAMGNLSNVMILWIP
jgi:hypothetical protein